MTDDLADLSRELGIDPEALRARYRAERDKRLRGDGLSQYTELSASDRFAADPFTPLIERDAVDESFDVLLIGAGFAGLTVAGNLIDGGVTDIRVVENGGDFGGTWYWNRYPGVRCDVESYIYLPLLEQVGTVPSEKYIRGSEIYEHCRAIAEHYDLRPRTYLQTQVTRVEWDEDAERWTVFTNRGDTLRPRFVVLGTGVMSRPKLPNIPGVETFSGKAFHTSRWDYDYTGGDTTGGLTGLKGKKVGIIGTGATAIQVIPEIAEWADEVVVFQRTPSAVDERNNEPTDLDWFRSQEPGWQRRRIENFDAVVAGVEHELDLVGDKWTELTALTRELIAEHPDASPAKVAQMANFAKMEQLRQRVEQEVRDTHKAELLKAWYDFGCKRPLFSDQFLPVFNRDNVRIVDTHGFGVTAVTEDAIVVGDEHYPVDCIIYSTGFRGNSLAHEAGGFDLIGRGGVTIDEKWSAGVTSLHGIQTRGFPNLMIVGGVIQATASPNFTHTISGQARHIASIITKARERGADVVEVTEDAEAMWCKEVEAKSVNSREFELECTPSYFNNEGDPDARQTRRSGAYGGGIIEYFRICEQWLEESFDQDLELRPAHG